MYEKDETFGNEKLHDVKLNEYTSLIERFQEEIKKVIVGQNDVIQKMLTCLLSGGHILIEGVPGLAKTLIVKTIASIIDCDFSRIQFTPDLLPADILGTMVYNQKTGEFYIKKGPIFSSIILADEINRAPAKTQSALLEAMQERQVTIGDNSFPLDRIFMVIATQNPIEQHGTYPLPEAQVDRFMMKLKINYPTKDEEMEILSIHGAGKSISTNNVLNKNKLLEIREAVHNIYIDKKIEEYIVNLVVASRNPELFNIPELSDIISYGASPRASIYLKIASKSYALIKGRDYVIPDDVQEISYDILRHRIILSYEAQAEEIDTDRIIEIILDKVDTP